MPNSVTLTGATQQAAKTDQQAIKLADDFSDFLTLLTTQLQNQDPLSPMDSTEFTNQLVQFSQVEQAINTNQKLDSLLSLQLASISSVALGYVGLDISYLASDINYDGEQPVKITYSFDQPIKLAKMNVYDEAGELVYSQDAPRDIGRHDLLWDGQKTTGGKAEPGTYTVRIEAVNDKEEPVETRTVVTGRVRGIESQDGVIYLLVGDRAVALGTVINAYTPQHLQDLQDQQDAQNNNGGQTPDEEENQA